MKSNIILFITVGFITLIVILITHKPKVKSNLPVGYNVDDAKLWANARNFYYPLEQNPDELESDLELLGQMLYFDTRLSVNGTQSCNTCHNLDTYGVDNFSTSSGAIEGMQGDRNSPTVLNASLHQSQFWDGRAATLEEQAKGPILNPVEMAIPHEGVLLDRLKDVKEYVELFESSFPEHTNAITYNNVATAIGAFERRLTTRSRFDDFMALDFEALNIQEKRGLKVFLEAGCQSCHDGVALGGVQFRRFGEMLDYTKVAPQINMDEGMYKLTQNPGDLYKFKVPSLRNIEKTYPYFHDGSVWDLEESVDIMAKTQLNKTLSEDDLKHISIFLKSLTGEVSESIKSIPTIPAFR
ncbi:cytochrome-c peroxidase [Belliella aquatica]|uniref:Cytochrome-c peroxidase n=1 Tax=Belliella aquatica TaxID=1323734 RepID=A0ABQ1N2F4_9BACT|nr:cytochrome c peroxidase [Belliella aquatica]MCH7407141.1 c-type cytochrome [Belliella aquatica]GGC51790.1 cytochrome-c peroxidase [Belliella aquatica]